MGWSLDKKTLVHRCPDRQICGSFYFSEIYRHPGVPAPIRDYVNEVRRQLEFITAEAQPDFGLREKLSFLQETRHTFGRTALLLSGGGALGAFHLVGCSLEHCYCMNSTVQTVLDGEPCSLWCSCQDNLDCGGVVQHLHCCFLPLIIFSALSYIEFVPAHYFCRTNCQLNRTQDLVLVQVIGWCQALRLWIYLCMRPNEHQCWEVWPWEEMVFRLQS